jgi:hypothetical protein
MFTGSFFAQLCLQVKYTCKGRKNCLRILPELNFKKRGDKQMKKDLD